MTLKYSFTREYDRSSTWGISCSGTEIFFDFFGFGHEFIHFGLNFLYHPLGKDIVQGALDGE